MSLYIFGYGSLMDPGSIAWTIPDFMARSAPLMPSRLAGFVKTFTAVAENDEGLATAFGEVPAYEAFANVEPRSGKEPEATCLGAVFPIHEADLPELDEREYIYERLDVTDRLSLLRPEDALPPGARVLTYSVPLPPSEEELSGQAGIRRDYVDLMRAAGARFDRHLPDRPFDLEMRALFTRLGRWPLLVTGPGGRYDT